MKVARDVLRSAKVAAALISSKRVFNLPVAFKHLRRIGLLLNTMSIDKTILTQRVNKIKINSRENSGRRYSALSPSAFTVAMPFFASTCSARSRSSILQITMAFSRLFST